MARIQSVEKGDIYFFYRYKVDTVKGSSIEDIARFYLVLNPDEDSQARLFLVGKKKMPQIQKGKSKSAAKEWMRNESRQSSEKMLQALKPISYKTKTKGLRTEPGAICAGTGRYHIFKKEGSTELAYKLDRPERTGKVQKELNILSEASYIISVKNPEVKTPGFSDEDPGFPKSLEKKFAEKRWLSIEDPKFLNYENAQFLLIGAHSDLKAHEVNVTGRSSLFKSLKMSKAQWPMESLEKGRFAKADHDMKSESPENSRTKGGRIGGVKAQKTDSASGVAKALKGINLPRRKSGLVSYAKENSRNDDIVKIIKNLPDRNYKTMADVQKGLGEVR